MRLCQKLGVALCALTLLTALAGRACAEDEAKEPSLEEKVATLQSDLEDAKTDSAVGVDTLWVLIAGFLVFFMNAGFGCVEAGFCRAKNAVNILGKNFVVFGISSLAFWIIGWAIMFGDGNDYMGTKGWLLKGPDHSPSTVALADLIKADINDQYGIDLDDEEVAEEHEKLVEAIDAADTKAKSTIEEEKETYTVKLDVPGQAAFEKDYPATDFYWGIFGSISWTGIPLLAKFFFQLVFAGTAATIVSGCVAERIHYKSYMVFTVFLVALSYPITGHWIWGGGWLANVGELFGGTGGFWDFAGSTVVHSVGGWAGLAGILLLGSRIGKYRDGKPRAIPGHSMALAFLGGLILWLGWFGFNPGSTMAMAGNAGFVSHVVITTNLACASGLLAATIVSWVMLGKPDFSMTINGALAGLVAITAPCAFVTPESSVIIGVVAGVLVVFSVIGFDRIKIDDPVGALSVHLSNGIWGTLSIGLFATTAAPGGIDRNGLFFGGDATLLGYQAIGVVAVGAITFGLALVVWFIIKSTIGLRVDPDAEMRGLDVSEMGMEAYSPDVVA